MRARLPAQGYAAARKPKGHVEGLRVRYSSATAAIVEVGSCRSSDDTADLTLSSESTPTITTINAISGLDEKTATATATTHGTATFEPTASLYVETPLSGTVRSLTGTITTTTTSAAGTSTKFLTELAIGDVIRSATKGASRVTAIASDTACTLVATLPGGDATAEAFTCYENLIVRIAAETPKRVNTISHNGLSVVCAAAWTSSTSEEVIKLGGEAVSACYYVWLVNGSSGTGCIYSTQYTTPYGVTGYTTARRLVGAVFNNSSGNIDQFTCTDNGRSRWFTMARTTLLSTGTATVYTRVAWGAGVTVPATAQRLLAEVQANRGSAATNDTTAEVFFSQDGTNPLPRLARQFNLCRNPCARLGDAPVILARENPDGTLSDFSPEGCRTRVVGDVDLDVMPIGAGPWKRDPGNLRTAIPWVNPAPSRAEKLAAVGITPREAALLLIIRQLRGGAAAPVWATGLVNDLLSSVDAQG
jgi:hypothetical protein